MKKRNLVLSIFVLCSIYCCGSSSQESTDLNLRIIHLNDSHSHLDPLDGVAMSFNGVSTQASLGGLARAKTAIDSMRENAPESITLHAGDMVQGTFFFTFYGGIPDVKTHNILGIDAMTLGNHEFDKGPEFLNSIISLIGFPIISANIDFSKEPRIKHVIRPFIIKQFEKDRIGIIGVTTTDTAYTSSPGPNIVFNDVTKSVSDAVKALEAQGINKIIVLSHIGYDNDIQLAKDVAGIDVVVGGHSHTLLGDRDKFALFGITIPEGYEYPSVVKNSEQNVLIAQAWCYTQAIGCLDVVFDSKGNVKSYSGSPVLVGTKSFKQNGKPVADDVLKEIMELIAGSGFMKIFDGDAAEESIIKPYRDDSQEKMKEVIASAEDDLVISLNGGPGPIAADSMVYATKDRKGVQISIENRGAMRGDIPEGEISYGKILEVLPFGSTVFVMRLTGTEVKNALEDGIDFVISRYHDDNHYPYVSGIKYSIMKNQAKGERIADMKFKNPDGTYSDFDLNGSYMIAVNSYLASGGDGFTTLKNATNSRYDTGFVDYEVLADYMKYLYSTHGPIKNPAEQRIIIVP